MPNNHKISKGAHKYGVKVTSLRKTIDNDKFKQFYFVLVPNKRIAKENSTNEYTVIDFKKESKLERKRKEMLQSFFHFNLAELSSELSNRNSVLKPKNTPSTKSISFTKARRNDILFEIDNLPTNIPTYQSILPFFNHFKFSNINSQFITNTDENRSHLMLSLDYDAIAELLMDEQSPYYQMLQTPIVNHEIQSTIFN